MENSKIDGIGWWIKIVSIVYIMINTFFIAIFITGIIMEPRVIDTIRSDISLTSVEYEKILYTGILLSLIHIGCIIMILKKMKIGIIVFYAVEILSILYSLIVQGEKFNFVSVIFPIVLGVLIYRKRTLYSSSTDREVI